MNESERCPVGETIFQLVPVFVLLIFFAIVIQAAIRSTKQASYKRTQEFLRQEEESNNVRKKDIDEALFFVPDLSALPIKKYSPQEAEKFSVLISRQEKVVAAAQKKMIKFKEEKTNHDVKLQFGTVNLETIANYEENYSQYMYALINWAESLIEAGNLTDAQSVLSASIDQGSEISKSFTLLADIYFQNNDKAKMEDLYETVNTINIPAGKKAWEHINGYLLKM